MRKERRKSKPRRQSDNWVQLARDWSDVILTYGPRWMFQMAFFAGFGGMVAWLLLKGVCR